MPEIEQNLKTITGQAVDVLFQPQQLAHRDHLVPLVGVPDPSELFGRSEPGEIGGYTHERVVRAPASGIFTSPRRIGERVEAGDVLGSVAGVEMKSQIAGVLRGLLWPGLRVTAGFKVADVDPRGGPSMCYTLSDKARIISGSVLEIVVAHAGGRT